MSEQLVENFMQEYEWLNKLKHVNIIKVFGIGYKGSMKKP